MKLIQLPGESARDLEARQEAANRAISNYPTLVSYESGLGVPGRSEPAWPGFRSPQHPTFESPLVGPDTADRLAKMDYFGWQQIQSLKTWGTIVEEPLPRLTIDDVIDWSSAYSPVPIPARELYMQALQATTGPRQGTIIGRPGQGTHSRRDAPNNWQSDNAVDISLRRGTPIKALQDGRISTSYGFGDTGQGGRFAGKRLHLEFGRGNVAYYAHLDRILVQPGDRVRAGQVIGFSGVANGSPHLHLGLLKGNPINVLKKGILVPH